MHVSLGAPSLSVVYVGCDLLQSRCVVPPWAHQALPDALHEQQAGAVRLPWHRVPKAGCIATNAGG
jgi:hypothetical protein